MYNNQAKIIKPFFLFNKEKRVFNDIKGSVCDVQYRNLKGAMLLCSDGQRVFVPRDAIQMV